ncbi:MAG: P-loop NTPase, partial [Oscillospiraceae bacterium]|nr:P-loop NTPase [Oscillospiraceae bacterium]
MNVNLKALTLITGHYGCGKTNFALNLACTLAERGKSVTLVDLDIVNPYFRSSDYPELLEKRG